MVSVTEEIHNFIKSRYPTAAPGDRDDIFSLGYVNSLFAMELVTFIERQFAFSVPNDELKIENFRTIAAMTDLVERQLLAQSDAR